MAINHNTRVERARQCLEGLSVGDAFGQRFFFQADVDMLIELHAIPQSPWWYTDDTVMAMSVYETLREHGKINQNDLASRFSRKYTDEPGRQYGPTIMGVLEQIEEGVDWRIASRSVFDGQGSMGNGSAMRVGPVGAYFCDDPGVVVENAIASAEVTHSHPDAALGAIAIALGVAYAARSANGDENFSPSGMVDFILQRMPDGPTTDGIRRIAEIPEGTKPRYVANVLGNGTRILCSDTVPYCIWCAANYIDSYENAMWATLSGLGDRDTTCAIVGGIVVMYTGASDIPAEWVENREMLNIE